MRSGRLRLRRMKSFCVLPSSDNNRFPERRVGSKISVIERFQ
jgi:hypothetical protein